MGVGVVEGEERVGKREAGKGIRRISDSWRGARSQGDLPAALAAVRCQANNILVYSATSALSTYLQRTYSVRWASSGWYA